MHVETVQFTVPLKTYNKDHEAKMFTIHYLN